MCKITSPASINSGLSPRCKDARPFRADLGRSPAGLAFARALTKQPELNLYAADKRHPSLAGTYLATCTTFAALTGRSPVGNTYLAGIDEQTAHFLQTVAWETVQDYYGK